MTFEKGEERDWQKVDSNTGQSRQKDYSMQSTIYATGAVNLVSWHKCTWGHFLARREIRNN